jgi:hypothetical protein
VIRLLLAAVAVAVAGVVSMQLGAETRDRLLGTRLTADLLDSEGIDAAGIVFVFQQEDCFGEGDLLQGWNDLHAEARFGVRGLIVGDGTLSPVQEQLFRERRIEMPVAGISRQAAAVVAARLGYTLTPFAVVLSPDGGIVASFPAGRNVPVEVLESLISGDSPADATGSEESAAADWSPPPATEVAALIT